MTERTFSVKLAASVDQYVAAMAKAQASTATMSSQSAANMKKLGGDMQNVGKRMTSMVSLPVAAAGVAAVKMSMDFEGAFSRMQGLAGVASSEIDGLKKSVLELAGKTARSPQELAEALYFLRSSGLDAGEAMEALDASAKASAAGLGSSAVIADAVSSAMNAYATSGLSAAKATDILVATARAGKAEPDELAGALGRVLPVAAELGVTFEDVGGAVAAFSLTGNDASGSVTLLSNVLLKLLKPSQQGAEALAKVGESTDTIRASIAEGGLQQTLEDLRNKLGDSGFNRFLEDAQAVTGALALTGDNFATAGEAIAGVKDNVNALGDAFKAREGDKGFQIAQAWSDIQVAMIQAGDIILPILADVGSAVAGLAQKFSSLPEPVQKIVVAALAFAAAAGPMVVLTGTLLRNFTLVSGAITRASTSTGLFARTASAAGTGLGVMAAGLLAVETIDQLTGRTGDATKEMTALLAAINEGTSTTTGIENIVESFLKLGNTVQETSGSFDALGDMWAHGGSQAEYNMFSLTEAFDQLLAKSPDAAAEVVDALELMEVASRRGSEGTKASALSVMSDWGLTAEAIAGFRGQTDQAFAAQQALTGGLDAAESAIDDVGTAAGNAGTGMEDATLATLGLEEGSALLVGALKGVEEEERAASEAADALADTISDAQSDFDALAAAADHLRGSLDSLISPQMDLAATTRALYDGMDNFKTKVAEAKESGDKFWNSLDVGNQTGRDNQAMVDGMIEKTIAHGAAMVADGKSINDAGLDVAFLTQNLVDQMVGMGFTEEAARGYIDTLGLTPETISTAVTLANDQVALDRIEGLQEELAEVADAETIAKVDALVEAGELKAAIALMERLLGYNGRRVTILAGTTTATTTRGGGFMQDAQGAYVPARSFRWGTTGEEGPEAILPLDKAGRLRQLLADPRIGGPIMQALGASSTGGGGGGGGGGALGSLMSGSRNLTVTMNATPAAVGVSNAGTSAAAVGNDDELMANRFERGDLSAEEYDAYLAQRQATEVLYSNAETALWSKREQIRIQQARTAEQILMDEMRARDEAAEAEKRRIADELAAEDQRMAAMHEMGEISNAEYERYLTGRQQSYGRYSDEWMAIHREIQGMHRAEEAAQRQAMADQAAAAEAALRVSEQAVAAAYQRSAAQHALAMATAANLEADAEWRAAEVAAYLVSMDGNRSLEEKAAAAKRAADATMDLAQAAERLRKAQATAAGLKEGTAEWATHVRSALQTDATWNADNDHGALATALSNLLVSIPTFGDGGYLPPRAGGHIIRVAERGQGEYIHNEDQYRMLTAMSTTPTMTASTGASIVNHYNTYQIDASGLLDEADAGRKIDAVLRAHDRRNGR